MQLSAPRKCPDCDDGRKGEKWCIICRGSGWVHLVPAERPPPYGCVSLSEQLNRLRDEDVYA
jgi:hypothetical protein